MDRRQSGGCWPRKTSHAAGLLIADNGLGGVLSVKQHDVRVVINNGVAVTEVEQVFVNTENRVVEAFIHFPCRECLGIQLQHVDQRQGNGR